MVDRRFLVLFDEFPIDEAQVRSGENPPNVIVASRCVNVALFLSGDLRRDVAISIAWGETEALYIITFPGKTLKRVSPDERSISFFLLKASREVEDLSLGKEKAMDSGILVKRAALDSLLEDWSPSDVYVALEGVEESDMTASSTEGVFLYGLDTKQVSITGRQTTALPRPRSPERFILDINMKADRIN